jgi:NitT/TauT family transport system substrate-binding protein
MGLTFSAWRPHNGDSGTEKMKTDCLMAGIVLGVAALAAQIQAVRAADVVEVANVGSVSPIAWPGLIADREGMFTAEGLDVRWLSVQSSAALVQQLAAGSLNVAGSTALVDPIRAVQQGAPIGLIRLEGQKAPFALVGKPTIKSIKDLKGKKIMIGGPKDITRFYLDRMFIPNGLKEGDYDLLYSGATPARFAALKSGGVDAVILFPPFNLFALAEGFSDLGGVVDYAPDLPFSGISVNRTWALSNKSVVERYLRAINRAIEFFNTDTNRNRTVTIMAEAMKGKPEDLAKTYDYFRQIGFYAPTAQVSRAKLNEIIAMMKAGGDFPQDLDINKLFVPGITQVGD